MSGPKRNEENVLIESVIQATHRGHVINFKKERER